MLAAACAVGVACTFVAPIGGQFARLSFLGKYFFIRNDVNTLFLCVWYGGIKLAHCWRICPFAHNSVFGVFFLKTFRCLPDVWRVSLPACLKALVRDSHVVHIYNTIPPNMGPNKIVTDVDYLNI